jgi:hypothetical protein
VVVVIIAVILLIGVFLPILPTTQSESIVRIYDQRLQSGFYTWRDFVVDDGSKVTIEFECSGEVNVFLFTLNQFTNFQHMGEEYNVDSLENVEFGTIEQTLNTGGIYYIVIFNPGESSNTVQSAIVTSEVVLRVSLLQRIMGN